MTTLALLQRCRPWLVILWLLLASASASAEEGTTRQRIEQVRQGIGEATRWLKDAVGQGDAITRQLRNSELALAEHKAALAASATQIRQHEAAIAELDGRRQQLQQQLDEQKQQIAEQLRLAQRSGQDEPLKLLLNQQDPSQVARLMSYYGYLSRAQNSRIEAYRRNLAELDALEPRIRQQQEALQAAQRQQQAQLASLEQERTRHSAALNRLQSSIVDKQSELKRLEKDRAELQQVLEAILAANREAERKRAEAARRQAEAEQKQAQQAKARAERAQQAEKSASAKAEAPRHDEEAPAREVVASPRGGFARGQLPWPVRGKLLYRYGSAGAGGIARQGILIAAQEGSPVTAVQGGRVVFANWLRGTGLLLIIDHQNGFMSLYAHNQSLGKRVGDAVRSGEPIGTVGSSGGQRSSGLHFEIRYQGQPQDPLTWLTPPG
ncbi:MAG TPA: peptidoglycan DD-metalloendopeptidase family protein [Pseudomonadales bacterium]|nr:peptidoglycan DD-metalloendopeptidase family protein [Pseudomonadales bacterium]